MARREPEAVKDAALTRFSIIARIVGTLLLVLVFLGIPLQLAGHKGLEELVGVVHGVFFYPLYLLSTVEMSIRRRWHPVQIVLVALCGTIPFLSFYAEHTVVRRDLAHRHGITDRAPTDA